MLGRHQVSISKLRAVAKRFPTCWKTRVYTAQEIGDLGILDPPCAMLEARWGPFEIQLDVDGEVGASFRPRGGDSFISGLQPGSELLDMSKSARHVHEQVWAAIVNMGPKNQETEP
jgi:hypothetical protein